MKTLEEIYRPHAIYEDLGISDKGSIHAYIPEYEKILAPYRENITFLEVGINQCHSLKMFGEYFINSRIIGADIWEGSKNYVKGEKFSFDTDGYMEAKKWLQEIGEWDYISTHGFSVDGLSIVGEANALYTRRNKVEVIIGDATKPEFLNLIGETTFDVILDDASHMMNDQLATYELLKGRMNKGGIYLIEDLINFEVQKPIFEEMGFEVIDLRDKKGRYDDAITIKRF